MSTVPWLVVGLGNPGPSYAGHRHNVGFAVVEELASRRAESFRRHKSVSADVAETRVEQLGDRMVLVKPRSYMNLSGGPVAGVARCYKIPAERVVVVHDELDIGFDTIRVKLGGGDNGHNGLRSIRSSLSTGDFYRVRIGIGRPPGRTSPADFVLSDFSSTERKVLPHLVVRGADAVESLILDGLEATQRTYHAPPG